MAHSVIRIATAATLVFTACLTLAADGQTRPLKKEKCEELSQERANLAQKDVVDALVKGPDWAKANMPKSALLRIQRYLIVEEHLRFRCAGVEVPVLASVETQEAANAPERPETEQGSGEQPSPAPQSTASTVSGRTDTGPAPEPDAEKRPKQGSAKTSAPAAPAAKKTADVPLPKKQPASAAAPKPPRTKKKTSSNTRRDIRPAPLATME